LGRLYSCNNNKRYKVGKSSGNEKEVESAQVGMKKGYVGLSMFFLFMIANFMSYLFIGTSFDRLVGALGICGKDQYVFQYARDNKMDMDKALEFCQSSKNSYVPPHGN
jgi:hypothetical protein